jgi:hypothetical protein
VFLGVEHSRQRLGGRGQEKSDGFLARRSDALRTTNKLLVGGIMAIVFVAGELIKSWQ